VPETETESTELEETGEHERRTNPVKIMEKAKRFFMVCSYSKSIYSIKRNERFSFFSLCDNQTSCASYKPNKKAA